MKVPRDCIVSTDGGEFGHFILSAITIMMQRNVEVPNPDEYDVTLTVNGVEIPFEEAFTDWLNRLDLSIERRAERLIADRFKEVRGIIDEAIDEAELKVKDRLNLC